MYLRYGEAARGREKQVSESQGVPRPLARSDRLVFSPDRSTNLLLVAVEQLVRVKLLKLCLNPLFHRAIALNWRLVPIRVEPASLISKLGVRISPSAIGWLERCPVIR